MFNVKRFISVPYNVEQMFVLVNDITSYSQFIPGCVSSRILKKYDNNELTAEINIAQFGVNESLITHNIVVENKSILMRLISGPFKSFCGYWHFFSINMECSIVHCYFVFEFSTSLIDICVGSLLTEKINRVVQAFIMRAEKIYNV